MKYLRLASILEDVLPTEAIDFGRMKFNGGERHIKLSGRLAEQVLIEAALVDSDYVMELFLATDALRRMGVNDISLLCPYVPYSRQDRVMVKGESLSVKVFASLLNLQKYSKVYTLNNHSSVATALINNCVEIDEVELLRRNIPTAVDDMVFISPDAGAEKKINTLAKAFKRDVVYASKIRNIDTGEILSTHVDGRAVCGKKCFILDDICDGGRTFIELAKALKSKGSGEVFLYVSHGIFSKGFSELFKYIDAIYTSNVFPSMDSRINIIKLRKEDLK